MQIIVFTAEELRPDEGAIITSMIDAGVAMVHVRKPSASDDDVAALLDTLPTRVLDRIVLHDHHPLLRRFRLYGLHLTGRHPTPPPEYHGYLSASCHSLAEVVKRKALCRRVTLSPIYDSVSKTGYRSAFTTEELAHARDKGVIDDRVVALGGITLDKIKQVKGWGFGAAALLGEPWLKAAQPGFEDYIRALVETAR